MHRTQISLEHEQYRLLGTEARREGISLSALIRRLVDQHFNAGAALAMDASAKEGDHVEAVVRLAEAVAEPVQLVWGMLGKNVHPFRTVVDAKAAAGDGDFDTTGACISFREGCRDITVPTGATEAGTFVQVRDDDRREPHEAFVIESSGATSGLPPDVTLPHKRPRWIGTRISQAVGRMVDPADPSHTASLFPAAGDGVR